MTIRAKLLLVLSKIRKAKESHGFTLIELLISMIVAGMVTSGLLYLVNEVIRIDRREARLETVQGDMQRAMSYITDELKEAVYVYSTPTDVTDQLTLSDLPSGTVDPVPVLAFWKPERISREQHRALPDVCTDLAPSTATNCQDLKLRQSYYSLVVYFALANIDDNPNWSGQTRIIRYVLPQYTRTVLNAGTALETPGFTAPANNFANWAPVAGTNTNGSWSVLTDYVDSTRSAFMPLVPAADRTGDTPDIAGGCDEFGAGYARSPVGASTPTDSEGLSYSFIACIGQPGVLGNGVNQDVIVLLRGNIKTAAQELADPTPVWSTPGDARPNTSVLPTLKSQVLVRGATNKNPGGVSN